jgi:hypothetical protein
MARVDPIRISANERVAQALDPGPSGTRVEIQACRCVRGDLAQVPAGAGAAVARLAVEEVPRRAGLVDRVGGVVHGDFVQVEGVVAVVEVAGARGWGFSLSAVLRAWGKNDVPVTALVPVGFGEGGGCEADDGGEG